MLDATLVDRRIFACRLAHTSPAAVTTRIQAEQRSATVRIVATEPTLAETAIAWAIVGNSVVSTGNRTCVIAPLELGALAADSACSAERDVLLQGDLGTGGI